MQAQIIAYAIIVVAITASFMFIGDKLINKFGHKPDSLALLFVGGFGIIIGLIYLSQSKPVLQLVMGYVAWLL